MPPHSPNSRTAGNGTNAASTQNLARRALWLPAPSEKAGVKLQTPQKAERERDHILAKLRAAWQDSSRPIQDPWPDTCAGMNSANSLKPVRENGQRNRGSGKKKKAHPDQLVDHLRFLHGVGHAGDDQAERGKSRRSEGDQQENRPQISPRLHVEHPAADQISITTSAAPGNSSKECWKRAAARRPRAQAETGAECLVRGK